ncbi:MAG: DUF3857 domain-containing protein [Puniceicoccaceae bacterium]|nr:MAG: DUF3857 domain-containing protein [Puniceicoccaceae bacterium]
MPAYPSPPASTPRPVSHLPLFIACAGCLVLPGCETTRPGITGTSLTTPLGEVVHHQDLLLLEPSNLRWERDPEAWSSILRSFDYRPESRRPQLVASEISLPNRSVHLSIVVGRIGIDLPMNDEQVAAMNQRKLEDNPDLTLLSTFLVETNGFRWWGFEVEHHVNPGPGFSLVFYSYRNGFSHQIHFDGLNPSGRIKDLHAIANQTLAAIRPADPQRFALSPGASLPDRLHLPELGASLDLDAHPYVRAPWLENQPGAYLGVRDGFTEDEFTLSAARLPSADLAIDAAAHGFGFARQFSLAGTPGAIRRRPAAAGSEAVEYVLRHPIDHGLTRVFIHHFRKIDDWAWLLAYVGDAADPVAVEERASRFFQRVSLQPPDRPLRPTGHADFEREFHRGLGHFFFQRRNYPRAIAALEEARSRSHDQNVALLLDLGYAHFHAGDPAAAYQRLQPIVPSEPDHLQLQELFGAVLHQTGRTDEAITHYERLFAQGLVTESSFGYHLHGLSTAGRWDEVGSAIQRHRHQLPDHTVRPWHAAFLRETGQLPAAIALLEEVEAEFDRQPDTAALLIDLYIGDGRSNQALDLATHLYQRTGSSDYQFLIGLSNLGLGHYADARQAFEHLLKANPGHAEGRKLLQQVITTLGETDSSLFSRELAPVPLPDVVRARFVEIAEPDPASGALVDYYGLAIHFERGQPQRSTLYGRYRILDGSGLAQLREIVREFDPLSEGIYVNRLEVFDADGIAVASGDLARFYLSDREKDGIVSSKRSLHLPVPGLGIGHHLELEVTRTTLGPVEEPVFERFPLGGLYRREVAFIIARGDLGEAGLRLSSDDAEFLSGEDWIGWIVEGTPTHRVEAFMPDYHQVNPVAWFGPRGSASWETLAHDYLKELAAHLDEPEASLTSLAQSLAPENVSTLEGVQAVARHLGDHFAYKAINFGIRGRIPNRPADILRNRFGDCKDQSLIMVRLLHELGIEAHLGLVNTRRDFVPDLPSLAQFDHMIVHIPGLEPVPWIDPADKFLAVGHPPRGQDGLSVLVLDPVRPRFETIPFNQPGDALVQVRRTVRLEADGTLAVEEMVELQGHWAAWLRQVLESVPGPDQTATLRNLLQSYGALVNLQDTRVDHLHDFQKPLLLAYRYVQRRQSENPIEMARVRLPLSWERVFFNPAQHDEDRRFPFEIRSPFNYRAEIHLSAANPGRLSVTDSLPPELDHPFGRFETSVDSAAAEPFDPVLRFAGGLRAGTFAREDHPAFIEFLETVLDSAQTRIELR